VILDTVANRRIVFFDLDGTLHQQDMFGCFLRYLLRHLPLNALLVLPVLPWVLFGPLAHELITVGHYLRPQ